FLEETHPCCQKDSEAKARALKLRSALDKVDPSQIAERARKAAFSSGLAGPPASRGGGGDYPALREARAAAAAAAAKDARSNGGGDGRAGYGDGIVEGHDNNSSSRVDSDDDDDDDLDYLLDDPEIARMAQMRVEAMHADATRLQNLRALGFGLHLEVGAP
ncbi:unnamed protein product, partial [Ectocarpus fasciculatus]